MVKTERIDWVCALRLRIKCRKYNMVIEVADAKAAAASAILEQNSFSVH
jgi:hypothetical protein